MENGKWEVREIGSEAGWWSVWKLLLCWPCFCYILAYPGALPYLTSPSTGSFPSPCTNRGFPQSSYILVLFLFSPSHLNISSPDISALHWANDLSACLFSYKVGLPVS